MSELSNLAPILLERRASENKVELDLLISADLDYFNGHFPEAPILAGVVQLDWAVNFGRQELSMPYPVKDIEVLKFQVVITPGMTVTLTLEKTAPTKFSFSYVSQKGQHASGRVLLDGI